MTVCRGLFEHYFLKGIKRVCINYPHFSKFEHMLTNYPYIDRTIFPALKPTSFIFFQNETLKEHAIHTYLQNADQIQPDSYEFHKAIGSILEFPPKAVEFYASGRARKEPRMNIYYYGNSFSSSIDDVTENVAWMWEKFPYPEDDVLLIRLKDDFAEVPYGDFDMLREIERNIAKMKQAGQI